MNSRVVPLYQVDAFTRELFKGNPAAVCLLSHAIDDALMQAVAAEMNLSETAFVMRLENRPWAELAVFSLRWFTPKVEVRLCGHATLATAAVLFNMVGLAAPAATFQTLSGDLVARRGEGGIVLDFPLDTPVPCDPPADVLAAIGIERAEAAAYGANTGDLLVHLADAQQVRALHPDFTALLACEGMGRYRALIATAPGNAPYDFVSRFFAPGVGINEDPVTGSAHTLLTPYWAQRLGKQEMFAYQASARGGELRVRLAGQDRVELAGNAVVVFEGELSV